MTSPRSVCVGGYGWVGKLSEVAVITAKFSILTIEKGQNILARNFDCNLSFRRRFIHLRQLIRLRRLEDVLTDESAETPNYLSQTPNSSETNNSSLV